MILLDTHVLIWWRAHDSALSARAVREISRVTHVLVSPISCWEIGVLQRRGRIALDRPIFDWVTDLYAEERIHLAPISPQAAVAASLLADTFGGDPADRFLYATARDLAVPFLTKDRRIRDFARASGDIRTIW